MSDRSAIEWTDATWNPIRGVTGRHSCVKISEGCANCYAERMNIRFGGPAYTVGADTLRLDEEALTLPLRWKNPRRIFVCSMTDLFEERVKDDWIDRLWAVMALTQRHTYQILTKRAERMQAYLSNQDQAWRVLIEMDALCGPKIPPGVDQHGSSSVPLVNVWLGVSVENQARADERIPRLLQTPARERFLSAEPLLGPINLATINARTSTRSHDSGRMDVLRGVAIYPTSHPEYPEQGYPMRPLDWVIVGGESGPGARPMRPEWARSIRDHCVAAGVPFFFKQHGRYLHTSQMGYELHREIDAAENLAGNPQEFFAVGKGAAGRLLDDRAWNEMPTVGR